MENLGAEGLVEKLIEAMKTFAGDTPQGDDQTVIALKVEAL